MCPDDPESKVVPLFPPQTRSPEEEAEGKSELEKQAELNLEKRRRLEKERLAATKSVVQRWGLRKPGRKQ